LFDQFLVSRAKICQIFRCFFWKTLRQQKDNLKLTDLYQKKSRLDESIIDDLQRQLNVKDDLLTETRLEALSSASQLQALREQVAKLRTELRIVKKENEDLKQTTKLNTPQKSIKNHNNQEEWIDSSLG
jgi:hypothetical protein